MFEQLPKMLHRQRNETTQQRKQAVDAHDKRVHSSNQSSHDRSLAGSEVAALFVDPASECCISAGLKDAFGVQNLDLSSEAMHGQAPAAITITPSNAHNNGMTNDDSNPAQGCASSDVESTLELDICGEITTASDCLEVVTVE